MTTGRINQGAVHNAGPHTLCRITPKRGAAAKHSFVSQVLACAKWLNSAGNIIPVQIADPRSARSFNNRVNFSFSR